MAQSVTIRVLDAAGGQLTGSTLAVADSADNAFAIPAGPIADNLEAHWHPGCRIEILLHKGKRPTRLLCDAPKFNDDGSVSLAAKAVTP